jgi:hypothetical protein
VGRAGEQLRTLHRYNGYIPDFAMKPLSPYRRPEHFCFHCNAS